MLYFNGTSDYLETPSITFDQIVMDVNIIIPLPSTGKYLWDARNDYNAFVHEAFALPANISTWYVDDVEQTDKTTTHTTHIPSGQRTVLKYVTGSLATTTLNMFSRGNVDPVAEFTQAYIYDLKLYNGATLVAHYDMSLGHVLDQSGNSNDGVLTGGTWIDTTHLYMDGVDDVLSAPSLTFDEIIMDINVPSAMSSGTHTLHDSRDDVTACTVQLINGNIRFGGWTSVYLDGTLKAYNTAYTAFDSRAIVRATTDTPIVSGPEFFNHFTPLTGFEMTRGKIHDIKIYNAGVLVAHYDMTTETVLDQSGNSNDATLTGGTWIIAPSGGTGTPVSYDYATKQTVHAIRSISYLTQQQSYEMTTTSYATAQRSYESLTAVLASKQHIYALRSDGAATSQVSYASRTNTASMRQAHYANRSSHLAVRQTHYADRSSLMATKQVQYDTPSLHLATKQYLYANQTTAAAMKQIAYASRETLYASMQQIYADQSTSVAMGQTIYASRTYDSDTKQRSYISQSDDFAMLQNILSGAIIVTYRYATQQKLYQTLISEEATKQSLYEQQTATLATKQSIYQDALMTAMTQQQIYALRDTILASKQQMYANRTDDFAMLQEMISGAITVSYMYAMQQSIYQLSETESATKQALYEAQTSQESTRQTIYEAVADTHSTEQILYKELLETQPTAQIIYQTLVQDYATKQRSYISQAEAHAIRQAIYQSFNLPQATEIVIYKLTSDDYAFKIIIINPDDLIYVNVLLMDNVRITRSLNLDARITRSKAFTLQI